MKLKIGTKLVGGFLIVAGIAMSVVIIEYLGIKKVQKSYDIIAGVKAPSAIYAINMVMTLHAEVAAMRVLMNKDFNKIRNPQYASIDNYHEKFVAARNAYELLPKTQEEAVQWNTFKMVYDKYQINFSRLIELNKSKDQLLQSGVNPNEGRVKLLESKMYEVAAATRPLWAESLEYLDKIVIINTEGFKGQRVIAKKQTNSIELLTSIVTILGLSIAVILGFVLIKTIRDSINKSVEFAKIVAQGDLTATIDVKTGDELEELADAFNVTIDKLKGLIKNVAEASDQVAASSEEMSKTTQALSHGAQQQASALEESTASMEEMSSSIKQVSDKAQNQASSVEEVTSSIEQLSDSIKVVTESVRQIKLGAESTLKDTDEAELNSNETLGAMNKIDESSKNISNIIDVISDIADQTNLLALNASIEAARAGEAGRGFAVVAKEISKLADKSAEATKEIAELIEETGKSVNNGVEKVKTVDESIKKIRGKAKGAVDASGALFTTTEEQLTAVNQIASAVRSVNEMAQGIASSSEEQSGATDEMSRTLQGVNQVTQQNAASAEELASATEEMASQAEELKGILSQFKV